MAGDAEVLDLNLDEVPLEMLVDDEGEEGKEDPKGKGPARDPSRRGCTVSVRVRARVNRILDFIG